MTRHVDGRGASGGRRRREREGGISAGANRRETVRGRRAAGGMARAPKATDAIGSVASSDASPTLSNGGGEAWIRGALE